ncbi:MAG: hypothetical protein ACRDRJ_12160, partial [Streptosporangiaceae bacterium]
RPWTFERRFDTVSHVIARVVVEPPPGWGPTRLLISALEELGYTVEEIRLFTADGGRSVLVLR